MKNFHTFELIQMEDMYNSVLKKVEKLTKNINKQFKDYNIRGFTIEYEKQNIFENMKKLAYKKFRKSHLVIIFRKYYINILTQNELKRIKRTRSHKNPYHIKTYHKIIYRNFLNFQYRPYVMPLTKEDKEPFENLNITDIKKKRNKTKKKIYIDPYLNIKIKNLKKISQRLKEKEIEKSSEKKHIFNKINVLAKRNSNPELINNNNILKYNKYLINNWNNQRRRIQEKMAKLNSERNILDSLDNIKSYSSNNEEKTTNYKSYNFMQSIDMKKGGKVILPTIKKECLSTMNDLKKINKNLIVLKFGKNENNNNNETKIDDKNLLNLNIAQLYKLFYLNHQNKNKNKLNFKKKKEKETNKLKENIIVDNLKQNTSGILKNKDINYKKIEKNKIKKVKINVK